MDDVEITKRGIQESHDKLSDQLSDLHEQLQLVKQENKSMQLQVSVYRHLAFSLTRCYMFRTIDYRLHTHLLLLLLIFHLFLIFLIDTHLTKCCDIDFYTIYKFDFVLNFRITSSVL